MYRSLNSRQLSPRYFDDASVASRLRLQPVNGKCICVRMAGVKKLGFFGIGKAINPKSRLIS